MTETRKPKAFDLEASLPQTEIIQTDDVFARDIAPVPEETPRRAWLWTVFWSLGSALFFLIVGNALFTLVEDLAARSPVLGYAGLALVGAFALILVILAMREWLAMRRLARVDDLRQDALAALESGDRAAANAVLARLAAHFSADTGAAAARSQMQALEGDVMDGPDRLKAAERAYLADRDGKATSAILSASKRVSVVTAISPRAWVDILFVLAQSIKLVRQIASLYGARPGGFAAIRLYRRVFTHLAITGGVAMTDSVLSQLVGAGLAARISAKLGEGLLNGVLTARVGLAAQEVCRPLPFAALTQARLADLANQLMKGG
jgi:putative membrane protein